MPPRSVAAVKVPVVNISYYDAKNSDLMFATNDSGNWTTTRVDSEGNVGQDTSLAVDSKGKMHIAYYDDAKNFDLKYASNASGAWKTTTIDADGNTGWYPSIAVDSNDNIHIAYADNTNRDLKYATNASGAWVKSVVDKGAGKLDVPGRYISLVLDKDAKAHIGYQYLVYASTASERGVLKYATNVSGTWSTVTVDKEVNSGFGVSTKIDAMGKLHMSYLGSTQPKYANNVSGAWKIDSVASRSILGNKVLGFNTSLVLDSNNNPSICFVYAPTLKTYQLRCVGKTKDVWKEIISLGEGKVGTYNSLGVDDKNNLYVSFYNATKQVLEFATNATGSWVTSTVDSASSVGTWTSLVMSYNYVTPSTPPQPYGPYVPSTPPLPYQPYTSGSVTPIPVPPTPYAVEPKINLSCPPPFVDVNGDNKITEADTMLVTNYLNGGRTEVVRTGATWQNQVNPVDVDGNSIVTPLDTLVVVNAINQGTGTIAEKTCVPPPYAGH